MGYESDDRDGDSSAERVVDAVPVAEPSSADEALTLRASTSRWVPARPDRPRERQAYATAFDVNSLAPNPLPVTDIPTPRRACCPPDSFCARLRNRLLLEHSRLDNSPGFFILKSLAVCVLALLLDKGTRCPGEGGGGGGPPGRWADGLGGSDSVTSTFTGLLMLSPFMERGKERAVRMLIVSFFGAVLGTLVSAACYLPPGVDPEGWMVLLKA